MMKKTMFAAFLCILFLQNAFAQDSVDAEQIKDHIRAERKAFDEAYDEESEYWDYFIKLFANRGITQNTFPPKFYEDIKVCLISENPLDSLAADEIINEIAPLIPNNIAQTSNGKEANLIIELVPKNYWKKGIKVRGPGFVEDAKRLDRFQTWKVNRNGYNGNELKQQYFSSIIGDSITQEKRSKIVRYFVVRGLAEPSDIQNHWSIFTPGLYQEVRNTAGYGYYDFTERDKFCLSKLYAPDMEDQLKVHVLKEGAWYYLNFIWPSEYIIGLKVVIYILCFLFVLAFSYKPILTKKFKRPYLAYLVNALFICVVAFLAFLIDNYTPVISYFEGDHSRADYFSLEAFFIFLIVGTIMVAIASVLFVLEKYLIKDSYGLLHKILLKIHFTLGVPAIVLWVMYWLSGGKGQFIIMLMVYLSVFAIGRGIFLYFKERADALLRQKDVELSQLKTLKARAEVASLHARINPHFLYNSLNSIAGLTHTDADKTEKMALSLSDLFRHNINRENKASTTIKDEIEAVRSYLAIEQVRFGERMQYSITVDATVEEVEIPRNIIQPLVENAIKHGVSKISGKGIIKLMVKKQENGLEITVHDNGPDFPEGLVSGYGLQSVHDILELTYQGQASLNFENQPQKRIWVGITSKGLQKELTYG